jgi:hypothetical protein
MSSPLVAHLMNAAPADVPSLLADDVRFRSPFAEYEGIDTIARLFAVMPAVFDELALVRELRGDDRELAAVLRGRMATSRSMSSSMSATRATAAWRRPCW